jgi:hypothetical protein
VRNVGAAGTFVVRKPGSRAKFRSALLRKLPFEAELVLCDGRDLIRLGRRIPISKFRVEPSQINFESAGEPIALTVTGVLFDGSAMDITRSSRTTYRSNDARVAMVDGESVVRSVEIGTIGATGVIVRYGNQSAAIPIAAAETLSPR